MNLGFNRTDDVRLTGRFRDRRMEYEYQEAQFCTYRVRLAATLALLGGLYAAFVIPQFLTGGMRSHFTAILYWRAGMLAAFAAFAALTAKIRRYSVFQPILLAFAALFSVSYFAIVLLSGQLNYLIKCLDMVLIVLVLFSLPVDWTAMCIFTLLDLTAFFLIMHAVRPDMSPDTFAAGAVYLSLVAVLSALARLRICRLQRGHYAYSGRLRRQIVTDGLTGIHNRTGFRETCIRMMADSVRDGIPLSLAVFDIDDFKRVNDQYGHVVGDEVLIALARIAMQSADLKRGDYIARWGGEEFVILFPALTCEQASAEVQKLRRKLAAGQFGHGIAVTCSFGISSLLPDDTIGSLFDRADRMMYRAKQMGKDRCVCG